MKLSFPLFFEVVKSIQHKPMVIRQTKQRPLQSSRSKAVPVSGSDVLSLSEFAQLIARYKKIGYEQYYNTSFIQIRSNAAFSDYL